ncbi:MAG: thioesterase family protein [Actinomycetota bacterium]|nr:thioesterase family protein [Actinomycetota bacterium]MDQ2956621.1 thioesterase family protein [Actinomycetota bacterium]
MDRAFYTDLEIRTAGDGPACVLTGAVASADACVGPWSPELQHGGPPNALLVLLAERLAAVASGRDDLIAVRLAAEFLGPVPLAPLVLGARINRLSRTAVLVSAELGTPDRLCLQARVWLLAPGETAVAGETAAVGAAPVDAGRPAEVVDPMGLPEFGFHGFGYAKHLDWRAMTGSAGEPGPAAVWIRPLVPLVEGDALSALQRAALLADSASGISAELDWAHWSFANVDLDLHLFRPVRGDWLLVDAVTELGSGIGMTRAALSDLAGPVGAGLQTLLVRRSAT